jgi:hypothetical protein
MTRPNAQRLVNLAAILALVALALMAWSVVDPTPLAVIVAMTIGQVIGSASLVFLLTSIVIDLKAARVLSKRVD